MRAGQLEKLLAKIRGGRGGRMLNIYRMLLNSAPLAQGWEKLLTAIRIPAKWAGAKFYFEKVADRNTWDFALVNVASALKVNNGTIEAAAEARSRGLKAIGVTFDPKSRLAQTADVTLAFRYDDPGFGPGTRPSDVANFLVAEVRGD